MKNNQLKGRKIQIKKTIKNYEILEKTILI
jgi:hypothetical protein